LVIESSNHEFGREIFIPVNIWQKSEKCIEKEYSEWDSVQILSIILALRKREPFMAQTKGTLFFLFFFAASALKAQNFGSSYDFLIKETNARVAALGGQNVSLRDDDVQLTNGNPAVVNSTMARTAGFTVNPTLGSMVQYNLAYADSLKKLGNIFFNMQFLDYGKMAERDASGIKTGDFNASQYAFSVGTGRKKGNFHLGAAMKFSGFQIQGNQSYALMFDMGMFYQHPRKSVSYGLAIKNIGGTLKKFDNSDQKMPVPFNIQAGMTYKLEHMPLRISVTAFYLQETNIQYVDPNAPGTLDPNGVLVKEKRKITEQIARHLNLGGEFMFHKSFHLRVGYNHLRRKELRPDAGAGLTGFSLGCMINTKPINLSYTYSGWQTSGGLHFISLNCRLANFITKS
jgi:hypothetical protein